MNAIEIENPAANINVSELGVKFSENVSIEEWEKFGEQIGKLVNSSQFIVGDWLNFGREKWDRNEFKKRVEIAEVKTGTGSRHAESLRLPCKACPIRKPQPQVQFSVAQDSRQARADGAVEMAEHCREEGDDGQTPESVDRRGETAERR